MTTTREEQATVELGTTDVTPSVARMMVASFAITLMAVPAMQWAEERQAFAVGDRNSPWPSAAEILTAPTVIFQRWSRDDPDGVAGKTLAANADLLAEIQRYETSLEDRSITTTVLLGSTRRQLAGWFGWGTEDAWIGRGGWLFYRPDLDHSTGPPFLAPDVLARRRRGGREFSAGQHPDPRPAILDFARQLARRNIRLVLVPTPTKAMVHPEHFGGHTGADRPSMHNRSYLELVRTLEDNGVTVFDPLPILLRRRGPEAEERRPLPRRRLRGGGLMGVPVLVLERELRALRAARKALPHSAQTPRGEHRARMGARLRRHGPLTCSLGAHRLLGATCALAAADLPNL